MTRYSDDYIFEPHHEKTYLIPYVNNLCSLFSAFVVRCLDSIIPVLVKKQNSVAEQACLSLTWSQPHKDRVSGDVAHFK